MASRVSTFEVEVEDSATLIVPADPLRGTLWIYNRSGAEMFIGGADVTTETGFPLDKEERIVLYRTAGDLAACEAIYGIAASAQTSPADTRVLAVYSA